jgi:hypothetical protein
MHFYGTQLFVKIGFYIATNSIVVSGTANGWGWNGNPLIEFINLLIFGWLWQAYAMYHTTTVVPFRQ